MLKLGRKQKMQDYTTTTQKKMHWTDWTTFCAQLLTQTGDLKSTMLFHFLASGKKMCNEESNLEQLQPQEPCISPSLTQGAFETLGITAATVWDGTVVREDHKTWRIT